MDPRLKIKHDSTSFTNRPPISYKVIEYLENLINENLLKEKKIIVNGNWEIHLILIFGQETKRNQSDDIYMPPIPSRIIKEDRIKVYEILIPMKLIEKSSHQHLKTIELIFEAIKIFLTRTYKRISQNDMEIIWGKIDLKFLLSLPYPAPLPEQKYLGDVVLPNGEIRDSLDVYQKEGPFEIKRKK